MKKNQLPLLIAFLVLMPFGFLSFTLKGSRAEPPKNQFSPNITREVVIIASHHASFYRWTANDFTGATSYAWSVSSDLSNWSTLYGTSNTAIQGGDASCDVVYVRCIGYVNGVHTYVIIEESDLCVPYDVFQKDSKKKGKPFPISLIN